MDTSTLIGNSIRDRRLSLNLRMDDVARKANITRATLSSIENGTGNYSIKNLLNVCDILGIYLSVNNPNDSVVQRDRATRLNSSLDKKVNRFVVMCVEQYAQATSKGSGKTYLKLKSNGVIDDLINDYEDLHGMSTEYLNDYISIMTGDKK